LPEVEVLCDVDNPLCGKDGAARIFGPQKGATAGMVEQFESGLNHLADVVKVVK
jgi:glycerate kinase